MTSLIAPFITPIHTFNSTRIKLPKPLHPMSSNYFSTPLPSGNATSGVGLGYGIAIAVGILVLVSTIMLASYVCVRVKGGPHPTPPLPPPTLSPATVVPGLDDPTIASFPKFHHPASADPPLPCPICLSDYAPGDVLRAVPECGHVFHARCVDEWLRLSATCPLCRCSPVPSAGNTPVGTPLSELIPLALDGR